MTRNWTNLFWSEKTVGQKIQTLIAVAIACGFGAAVTFGLIFAIAHMVEG